MLPLDFETGNRYTATEVTKRKEKELQHANSHIICAIREYRDLP